MKKLDFKGNLQVPLIFVLLGVVSTHPHYLNSQVKEAQAYDRTLEYRNSLINQNSKISKGLDRQLEADAVDTVLPPQSQRRQSGGPPQVAGGAGESFINTIRGAGIALGDDQLEGASSLHAAPSGPDYVDYGAYRLARVELLDGTPTTLSSLITAVN